MLAWEEKPDLDHRLESWVESRLEGVGCNKVNGDTSHNKGTACRLAGVLFILTQEYT